MEKELSFGQTVYIVSYFQQSFGSSRKRRMMCVIRNTHYEVVECRVVSFNDKEVYLHSQLRTITKARKMIRTKRKGGLFGFLERT
ncbi:hypothetical protein LCGC14_2140700 [marine sediment metagenome]|uniref:Uncharacterized protein n=1 Tax=marine sediment metagenome TaxID=412755 RepID=A0A0F9DYR7_9ZZZZ